MEEIMPLTAAELAEFTCLNMVAFDQLRLEAQKKEEIPACWLVSSDKCKEQARQKVLAKLNEMKGIFTLTAEQWEQQISKVPEMRERLAMWQRAEEEYKAAREAGNPRAFFIGL